MNRLFKISALLLISFASTGCQNKVPTLEEEIYNAYSKEGYVWRLMMETTIPAYF